MHWRCEFAESSVLGSREDRRFGLTRVGIGNAGTRLASSVGYAGIWVSHYHGWIIYQQYAANWEALACREIIVFLHTPVAIKGQLQDALA
jgi:hypothetical protein